MPQLQLPLFPAGTVQVTDDLACRCEADTVVYFHGQLPVFSHRRDDVASFRMSTAQLIVHGSATQGDVLRAFGGGAHEAWDSQKSGRTLARLRRTFARLDVNGVRLAWSFLRQRRMLPRVTVNDVPLPRRFARLRLPPALRRTACLIGSMRGEPAID